MNNQDRITYVTKQIQENKATEAELLELIEMLKQDQSGQVVEFMTAQNVNIPNGWQYDTERWNKLVAEILNADKQTEDAVVKKGKVVRINWQVAAAAIIILVLGIGSYFMFFDNRAHKEQMIAQKPLQNDVAPGGDKAILTLADGRQIVLDSTQGTVSEGGVKILNLQGQLNYSGNNGAGGDATLAYNIVSTPRGGQYQLVLSDGSKVWLNSASTMRFPVAFQGQERKVEVTGEAYFEVAHNPSMPFIVKKGDAEVSVLGTHFNVDAYDDEEKIKVTLLEGKVRVGHAGAKVLLYPGQQAQIDRQPAAGIRVAKEVDIEEVVAWKNGKFQFGDAAEIDDALRQLARWYDVEFELKDNVSGHIGGTISRNVTLSQVLNMLEMTGMVAFNIEGNKVEVRAK